MKNLHKIYLVFYVVFMTLNKSLLNLHVCLQVPVATCLQVLWWIITKMIKDPS